MMSSFSRLRFNAQALQILPNRSDFPFYCDYDEARQACEKLGGHFWTIIDEGHETWTASPCLRIANVVAYLITKNSPSNISRDYSLCH